MRAYIYNDFNKFKDIILFNKDYQPDDILNHNPETDIAFKILSNYKQTSTYCLSELAFLIDSDKNIVTIPKYTSYYQGLPKILIKNPMNLEFTYLKDHPDRFYTYIDHILIYFKKFDENKYTVSPFHALYLQADETHLHKIFSNGKIKEIDQPTISDITYDSEFFDAIFEFRGFVISSISEIHMYQPNDHGVVEFDIIDYSGQRTAKIFTDMSVMISLI
jgi:hypothetical protein